MALPYKKLTNKNDKNKNLKGIEVLQKARKQ